MRSTVKTGPRTTRLKLSAARKAAFAELRSAGWQSGYAAQQAGLTPQERQALSVSDWALQGLANASSEQSQKLTSLGLSQLLRGA